jgi:hypothetical protein
MGMNERAQEQLDKILALADSDHEGEAVVAVRKAREMLSRDGLSFGDLARAALTGARMRPSTGMMSFLPGQRDHMEALIHQLRQEIDDLRNEMQLQGVQLQFWRHRATDLEQNNQQVHSEAERWKNLARETAERLWDIGQSVRQEEFVATDSVEEDTPLPGKSYK